jgi:hypothetical protein
MRGAWWLWLLLLPSPASADESVSSVRADPPLQLIDRACKLLVAKKYDSRSFAAQIGSDSSRKLPEQTHFPSDKNYARFVPPAKLFAEMLVSTSYVDKELFNQVTLIAAPDARLTVGALRKLFPSPPRFAPIMDAFDRQDLILERAVPGSSARCQLVVTVPRGAAKLDEVVVHDLTLQE